MSTVLILGATSDMAWATAKRFAAEGHDIILAARNEDHLETLKSDLEIRSGRQVDIALFDALYPDLHRDFYDRLKLKPDVIACFFGYLGDQPNAEVIWDESARIIHSNYTGAVSILSAGANFLLKQGNGGSIIGVSSVAGDRGRMSNYLYGSAKAGFTAFLSGLRNRLFHQKIHVMTVKPGFVATKMTSEMPLPGPLVASPEKVADDIYTGWKKRRNVIYTKWFWRYIMLIITLIPEPIFKKLKM
ncbi:MAG: SDR family oxidoreductase [Mucilaginibacter polytrichastri]|nr:SDR family oxidoreductase [Mucilaginibacter polytrichastri]